MVRIGDGMVRKGIHKPAGGLPCMWKNEHAENGIQRFYVITADI